ncbi:uncharacterized protein LOC136075962 [Hydra vulgaris]|uniref:Uncharacterized protein LOC136075962 n=1 Tax=Hydra vulgaris TaxID=6087 RepID=A0ABM4B9A9_HYDVU
MNKQSKTSYDLNEAIQYNLFRVRVQSLSFSDLELSCDEEDDNNLFVVTRINDEISICKEEQCMTADILLEDETNIEFTTPDKPSTNKQTSSSTSLKLITHNYKWCNRRPPVRDTTFSGCEFSLPPNNVDTFTPLMYFQMFWKDTLFILIAEQTNLYNVQISSKSVNVTETEFKQFIAMQMYMSIFLNCQPIISDNSRVNDPVNKHKIVYKIASVLDHVRQNCFSIKPENGHSIDEQIISAKTRYSGIRQYNPKKASEVGFQKLCILTTATIRNNRMRGCCLPTESELRKKGRGSHRYKCDINSGIIITRYDNRCVNLCSIYCDPDLISYVKRWNRTEKNFVNINSPSVVKEYNQCMGGVDSCDMLISLYRTNIKIKRWYIKILFHCIDICKVNGWLIYRRHCNQLNIAKMKTADITSVYNTNYI